MEKIELATSEMLSTLAPDTEILVKVGNELKRTTFQVLSNAVLSDQYFKIQPSISDLNNATKPGVQSLGTTVLNTPEPDHYWFARIYATRVYVLQDLRDLDANYTATRKSTDGGKTWSPWKRTTETLI